MKQPPVQDVPWDGDGPYFEDFKPGMRIKSWPGRTFAETDNYIWIALTGDCTPLYVDREYATVAEFGEVVIHPLIVLNAALAMSVKDTSVNSVAFVRAEYMRLHKHLRPGDTLYVETEVVEVRESKSRPEAGVVTWIHRGFDQRGELVCEIKRTNLVYRRAFSPWRRYLKSSGVSEG
ncbi:MAG: MaoC family dehydratase [Thaumarchaeota archaeon]|nr:MaoC family dehydratase [Candidatus Calditenuaceae archaeon]MDW8186779.1 MaoC family dehydratase [Nitrososphaerota archaeon]